jgi:ATP-dependent Lon protease
MTLKSREKILLFFVIIAIAIWAFDQFYYTSQKKKILTLKGEVSAADLKLKESALFTKGVETIEAEVSRLEEELKKLSERMLRGEEFRAFLKHLGKDSDRLQMKMISLTSQEEKISLREEKKSTSPFQYKKVATHMVLHSSFPALRTYLKGIEELPFLVMVDSLQVERIGETTPFLKVTMGLSVYVIT